MANTGLGDAECVICRGLVKGILPTLPLNPLIFWNCFCFELSDVYT